MGCGASKEKPGKADAPVPRPVDSEKQQYGGFVYPLKPEDSLSTIDEGSSEARSTKATSATGPSVPASATGAAKLDVRASGTDFVDAEGRRLTLRGVNLACKTPTTPNGVPLPPFRCRPFGDIVG